MSLNKIKELRIKAESAKALLELADSESDKKHYSKLLESYKKELLKYIDEPQPTTSKAIPNKYKLVDLDYEGVTAIALD